MSVVRRGSVGAVSLGLAAGLVLLGGPAWAQEDPCAPGADGSVPEMCQSGAPVESDTGTVGIDPEPTQPCLGQPVEPGDGTVTDEGDEGIAVGEPNPGAPSDVDEEPVPDGEPKEELPPAESAGEPDRVDPEQVDPATVDDTQRTLGDDGLICAFSGVPLSAPVADGAPEAAAGGGTAVGQLPRTGPYDRLLALAAVGSGLVVAGAGAAAAGRRRRAA